MFARLKKLLGHHTRLRLIGIALGWGLTVGMVLALRSPLLRDVQTQIEAKTLDLRFSLREPVPEFRLPGPITEDDRRQAVLHIDIDDKSIEAIGRWPWPREVHARMLEVLREFEPELLLSDVEFPNPSAISVGEDKTRKTFKRVLAEVQSLAPTSDPYSASMMKALSDQVLIMGRVVDQPLRDSTREILTSIDGSLTREVGACLKRIDAPLSELVRNHDDEFAWAMRRFGRFLLPFHFDYTTLDEAALEPHLARIREILQAQPEIEDEELARRLDVPRNLVLGKRDYITQRLFIAPAFDRLRSSYLKDLNQSAGALAEATGIPLPFIGINLVELKREVIRREIRERLKAHPDYTEALCWFRDLGISRHAHARAQAELPLEGRGPWKRSTYYEELRQRRPEAAEVVLRLHGDTVRDEPDLGLRDALLQLLQPEAGAPIAADDENTVRIYEQECDLALATFRTVEQASTPDAFQAHRHLVTGRHMVPAISRLVDSTPYEGYVSIQPDALDGVLRRIALFNRHDGRLYFQTAFTAVCKLLGVSLDEKGLEIVPGDHLTLRGARIPGESQPRDIRIPIDREGQALVSWAGSRNRDLKRIFEHLTYSALIEYDNTGRDVETNRRKIIQILGSDVLGRSLSQAEDFNRADHAIFAAAKPEDGSGGFSFADQVLIDISRRWAGREEELLTTLAAVQGALVPQRKKLQETWDKLPPGSLRRKPLAPKLEALDWALRPMDELQRAMRDRLRRRQELREHTLEPRIRGRIAILGDIHTGSTDTLPTPLHPTFPGVGLHSNIINMILTGNFIRQARPATDLWAALIAGGLLTLAVVFLSPLANAALTLLALVGHFWLCRLLFNEQGLWLDMSGPMLTIGLVFAGVTAFRQLTEERQKRQIRGAFSLYLHPDVIGRLERDPDSLKLGGESREMTVMFSDVAGFTTISESLTPEALVELLNDYLTPMSDTIMDHQGTVDKYEGDAIMAFWGAPLDDPDHALHACQAVLKNQVILQELNVRLKAEGRPPLTARVGLNTGPMVVGNMGSRKRFNYTIMGDAVNLGSRLEGANKQYGTLAMVSATTYEKVKDRMEGRFLDLLRVKGKKEPVGVYELVGLAGETDPLRRQGIDIYLQGLERYRARDFQGALAIFEQAIALANDPPSKTYRGRCLDYLESPPPQDWDGVYVMTTK